VFTDPVELHIYVDALPGGSSLADIRLHQEVIELCESWPWQDASRGQGGKRVAIRKEWVGLKRQWLECYVPRHVDDQAVILEDDCEVSPVFWQWAEKAAGAYSSRPDLAGIGLQRQQYVATGDRSMPEIENNNLPYLYRMPGFWGYRPSPSVWYKFLQWYSDHQDSPYVEGLEFTAIYTRLQLHGRGHSMWSAFFIKFCHEQELYTLYANLPNERTLVSNWRMKGSHFRRDRAPRGQDFLLQLGWNEGLNMFPADPMMLDWSAEVVSKQVGEPMIRDVFVARRLGVPGYDDDDDDESGEVTETISPNSTSAICAQIERTYLDSLCMSWTQSFGLMGAVFVIANGVFLLCQSKGEDVVANSSAIVLVAFLCFMAEYAMPSASKNMFGDLTARMDCWYTSMMVLFTFAMSAVRKLPATEHYPLNRAQTNEWKGWMQVAFVMYHYFEADDIFALIRCFVSAYVWMTGFGNGFYFWFKNEQRDRFTFARFAQSIWRINFLVVPLSLATATDWILYYVVMLHTLHFVMVFICLFLASVLSRRFGWSHTNREIALGIGLYFMLIIVVWEIPGLFQSTIEAACRALFGDFFAEYLTYRTTIDKWSSFAGLVFAAFYPNIKSMYHVRPAEVHQQQSRVPIYH
jgi:hypothetical protein